MAYDSRLGRDVALKTLPALFVADAERVARFEREARLLATLNHPNIATVYGFERQDGVIALVMELVEGETLDERLRRSAVPAAAWRWRRRCILPARSSARRRRARERHRPSRPQAGEYQAHSG